MSVRYTNQIRRKDCFPTALANLIKWSGVSFSYRDHFNKLASLVNLYTLGTQFSSVKDTMKLKIPGLSVKRVNKLSLKRIRDHVSNDGCVLFNYRSKNRNYHSALIVKATKRHFYIVNHSTNKLVSQIGIGKMREYISCQPLTYFAKRA